MIKAALLGMVSLIVSLELGAQVMPLTGNNEDLSIYGTDVTEFTWLRGQYTNHGGGAGGYGWRRRGGWWDTDYPDSDENFLRGVQRYTNVDTNPRNRTFIQLTDPRLFEHIFIHELETRAIGSSFSGPNFSDEEIELYANSCSAAVL